MWICWFQEIGTSRSLCTEYNNPILTANPITVKINPLQVTDLSFAKEGNYYCSVKMSGDDVWTKSVRNTTVKVMGKSRVSFRFGLY